LLLSERVRIEVFIPDLPDPSYTELLTQMQTEFSYAFGGCTVALSTLCIMMSRTMQFVSVFAISCLARI